MFIVTFFFKIVQFHVHKCLPDNYLHIYGELLHLGQIILINNINSFVTALIQIYKEIRSYEFCLHS